MDCDYSWLQSLPDAAIVHTSKSVLAHNQHALQLLDQPTFAQRLWPCQPNASQLYVDTHAKPWRLATSRLSVDLYITLIQPALDDVFADIFDNNPQPVVIHDWFVPLYANKAYAKAVHLDSVESVLQLPSMRGLIGDEHWEQAQLNYQHVLEHGKLEATPTEEVWAADGSHMRTIIHDFVVHWQGKPVLCTILNEVTIVEEQRDKFRQMALTDPLTGLGNRRQFDGYAMSRAKHLQQQYPQVALLIFDLDHFKAVNDTFGHPAGDRVLQHVAQRLLEFTCTDCLLCRIGGEEFAVVCGVEADQVGPKHPAEQIKAYLDNSNWPLRTKDEARITMSIGVALWQPEDDLGSWYQRADEAMYRAKQGGRNRIEY
ncbi:GGDEF domain-containing protein [uncultured Ferrimonas sp.]|uniref:GGDEF domain-containing protein n=1 Tax=uncultured Ferrimonas sp. TaxID=432640 RepID=UPI002632E620|nr:GGDEF domain-containing protein [uncultured Ferrimonas sp.]